jgi:hypothetical protein
LLLYNCIKLKKIYIRQFRKRVYLKLKVSAKIKIKIYLAFIRNLCINLGGKITTGRQILHLQTINKKLIYRNKLGHIISSTEKDPMLISNKTGDKYIKNKKYKTNPETVHKGIIIAPLISKVNKLAKTYLNMPT